MKFVALIPARSGSQRVVNKNIKHFGELPLIAYTLRAVQKSGLFSDVIVATDSQEYAEVCESFGVSVPVLRPAEISRSSSPDSEWLSWVQAECEDRLGDGFAILRPTSPFRSPETLRRAIELFLSHSACIDSLRAVQPVSEHPGKMWVQQDELIYPLMPWMKNGTPWHSNQSAILPNCLVQNASLEISTWESFNKHKSISGERILPFYTEGLEGFDINTPMDWVLGETLIKERMVDLSWAT